MVGAFIAWQIFSEKQSGWVILDQKYFMHTSVNHEICSWGWQYISCGNAVEIQPSAELTHPLLLIQSRMWNIFDIRLINAVLLHSSCSTKPILNSQRCSQPFSGAAVWSRAMYWSTDHGVWYLRTSCSNAINFVNENIQDNPFWTNPALSVCFYMMNE